MYWIHISFSVLCILNAISIHGKLVAGVNAQRYCSPLFYNQTVWRYVVLISHSSVLKTSASKDLLGIVSNDALLTTAKSLQLHFAVLTIYWNESGQIGDWRYVAYCEHKVDFKKFCLKLLLDCMRMHITKRGHLHDTQQWFIASKNINDQNFFAVTLMSVNRKKVLRKICQRKYSIQKVWFYC